MTDSKLPEGNDDLSAAPEYKQLGDEGNPFGNDTNDSDTENEQRDGAAAGLDQVPGNESAEGQNPPLPDWGPTDGTHGVDGADPNK